MKIKSFLLSAVLLGTTFISCVSDKANEYNDNRNRSIAFSSQIAGENINTRAANSSWNADDAIGVFMKTGAGLTNIVEDAENRHYVTPGNGSFTGKTATDAIYFPQDDSQVDFIAYYPFTTPLTNNIFKVDVTDQNSQPAIDLLYSINATGKKNGDAVHLIFDHQLTKVVFNLEGVNGVSGMNNLKVEIEDMLDKADFDLATGTLTPEATKAKIAMKTTIDATNALKAVSEGIVIPTAAATRKFIFTVDVAGVSKSFDWDASAQPFEAGKKNTYNIKLDGQLGAVVSMGSTINDWNTGTNEDIEIEIGGGVVTPGDGTQTNPFSVEEAAGQVGQTAKWVEGFILGSSSKTKSLGAATKDNIVLATKAGETDEAKWIIIDLVGSAVQGNLDIVANPTLVGKKVKVQGNVVNTLFGGSLSMSVITAQEGGAETTEPEPEPSGNLLFAGSDFNDWAAFNASLGFPLSANVVESATGGRDGSGAAHFTGTVSKNGYAFTAKNTGAFTTNPSKISFYLKGTTTGKSLSINVHNAAGEFVAFNVGDVTGDKTVLQNDNTPPNDYIGTINTGGNWVKITLDLKGYQLMPTVGSNMIAFKVGHTAKYDLLLDDITVE